MRNPSKATLYIYRWLSAFGWNPLRTWQGLRSLGTYYSTLRAIRKSAGGWNVSANYPQLHDRFDVSGVMRGHYFHQDLLIAQRIHGANPPNHLDVGSRTDGFVSHVASYRPLDVVDIRPNTSRVANIRFVQADITNPPKTIERAYDSVSCLHALEHFGLGRYGDPIDIDGPRKGVAGLARVVKPGGTLYLSVPIGRERIEFNAHRIYSLKTVQSLYSPFFTLEQFNFIDDDGDLHSATPELDSSLSDRLSYGCGIFQLQRRSHVEDVNALRVT